MTDTIVGAEFGDWTIVGVDASSVGKRAVARCACSRVRVVMIADLVSGESTNCGCRPLSDRQKETERERLNLQKVQATLRDWRPRGR